MECLALLWKIASAKYLLFIHCLLSFRLGPSRCTMIQLHFVLVACLLLRKFWIFFNIILGKKDLYERIVVVTMTILKRSIYFAEE